MLWFPVALECVDADSAILRHVGMKYLGQEEPLRGGGREFSAKGELDAEKSALERSSH